MSACEEIDIKPHESALELDTMAFTVYITSVIVEDRYELSFHKDRSERKHPSRSISESEVLRISQASAKRRKGELKPSENNNEQAPSP